MVLVETRIFTKAICKLMSDEEYTELQLELCQHPATGNLIPGAGGLRKIRWKGSGRGKRGGTRIIYYWWVNKDQISMLLAYSKNQQDDLTKDQIQILKKLMKDDE